MVFKDQIGRTIHLPAVPERIVSLVPSQTELLADLGLRDKLVGITKFCVHPEDLRKSVKIVGGTKSIHPERIQAVKPDFILCNKEENTAEMVAELETVAPVWVTDMFTINDSLEMILSLGQVLEVESKAKEIVANIRNQRDSFITFMKDKPSRKVIYMIWKNPWMAAGRNTFINELLELNKFENIITDPSSRYPEISESFMTEADLILLSTEPFPFKESHAQELRKLFNKPVQVVDGEYFSWYGSRLMKAFEYFRMLSVSK